MIRLFGMLVLVAAVAGCVTAQQPYDADGGPGLLRPEHEYRRWHWGRQLRRGRNWWGRRRRRGLLKRRRGS